VERGQHTEDRPEAARSAEYEPPLVEDLETEAEGATISVVAGFGGSGQLALAEPTDNPPVGNGG
jgi:hypothetical protein